MRPIALRCLAVAVALRPPHRLPARQRLSAQAIADGTGARCGPATSGSKRDHIASVGDVGARGGRRDRRRQRGSSSRRASSTSTTIRRPALDTRSRRRDPGRAGHHDARRRRRRIVAMADRRVPGRARQHRPAALNVMVMVGHATVRRAVMGDDYKRPARDDEDRADGDARRSGNAGRARSGSRAGSNTRSAATATRRS